MIEWFKNAKFGMMAHFGLYSLYEGVYNGDHVNEWVRFKKRIPYDEYHALAKRFNPSNFSGDEWAKIAKSAGMKYIVVTSKHHDGFALFDSKVSDFNIVKATPYGKDFIAELAEGCYKNGIKLGLYYSHDMDWDEPGGGGFIENAWENPGNNTWDFKTTPTMEEFQKYLDNKAIPQIEEILTGYGELCQIWFDNPWTVTKEQSERIYKLVKHYQPNCLVSERVGHDLFDIGGGGDNEIDMKLRDGKPNEVPATMSKNSCWCYRKDDEYLSASEIMDIKNDLNSKGINLLLNVGPRPDGKIGDKEAKILEEVGKLNS